MTDLANSCATPLFRRPQGSQGCLEKWNYPLTWNLVDWCAKIGPKTKKVWKTSELTKKNMSKMMVFQSFLVLGPILGHQTTKFELSGWFRFSRHPWKPWGSLNSGVTQELAKSVTVIWVTNQPPSKKDYEHDIPHLFIISRAISWEKNWVLDHQLFDAKCFPYKLV